MFCIILFEDKYVILLSKRQSIAKHRVPRSYVGCVNCPGCEILLCLPHGEPLQPLESPWPRKRVWTGTAGPGWVEIEGWSRVRTEALGEAGQVPSGPWHYESLGSPLHFLSVSLSQCLMILPEQRWHQQQHTSSAWSLARRYSLTDVLWSFTPAVDLVYWWFMLLSVYMHHINILLRYILDWM